MNKIIKYVLLDILRNKIVLAYTAFLLAISLGIFNLEDNSSKGLLSLLNIILIIVPLVSILFSAIYVYNSAEFIELLVSQPLKRNKIWLSLFAGLSSSLMLAFFAGVAIPVIIFSPTSTGFTMIAAGLILTTLFVSIAMLATVSTRDKAKGIGLTILLWLYFSILFDALVLFLLFQFEDYPLEKLMVAISALNPIDLARVLVLLKMDVSALMGYTCAIFRDFFGTTAGLLIAYGTMLCWVAVPVLLSVRKFKRKDL